MRSANQDTLHWPWPVQQLNYNSCWPMARLRRQRSLPSTSKPFGRTCVLKRSLMLLPSLPTPALSCSAPPNSWGETNCRPHALTRRDRARRATRPLWAHRRDPDHLLLLLHRSQCLLDPSRRVLPFRLLGASNARSVAALCCRHLGLSPPCHPPRNRRWPDR